MKKIILSLIYACLSGIFMTSCISTVPAGYRGIKVYLLGNKRGVEEKQLGVGAYFLGFNQRIYTFPVFQQNYVWRNEANGPDNSISFQSKEGLDVSGDFGISYSLVADSVPAIFQKYRRGIDEITNVFLRNMVRDALNTTASRMPIESIYGVHKRDLLLKVDSMVATQTRHYGIIIDRIYTIGELTLPPNIEAAINAKLAANQKAMQSQNEIKMVEAEANQKIAKAKGDAESKVIEAGAEANATKIRAQGEAQAVTILADAQAEANKKLANSVSKELINYRTVDKWDGKLPTVSGQTPFIQLPQPKQ
jgi:regulator of protease activity HflC (stomatin/prohibitin superfamily)